MDAFELCCWRRLMRVPWTARRSNQSILKEIKSEYSLEGLMLKLKFQYFGHLMQRADSLKETVMLGKIEGRRRRGWQRMTWLDEMVQWIWVWTNSGKYWSIGKPSMLQFKESQHQIWLNNWTITTTAPTHRDTHTHTHTHTYMWVYMYTYIHVHISGSL